MTERTRQIWDMTSSKKVPTLAPDLAPSKNFVTLTRVAMLRQKLSREMIRSAMQGTSFLTPSLSRRLNSILTIRFRIILFRLVHFAITLVVYQHFFYIKFRQREGKVPLLAPNSSLKRLVPPFEFGAMHAILFQLAVIPLTMCRSLLATLSTNSTVNAIIPFENLIEFHIFVGYLFCIVMVLSVIVFFGFFGKVCSDFKNGLDPINLCANFGIEIMGTGYAILFITLIVGFSALFRSKLRYNVFYGLHLLVFVMYFIATIHTLDDEFRAGTLVGNARSQTFVWFTASLCLYATDRLWGFCSSHSGLRVLRADIDYDHSTCILVLKRPVGYKFVPGQHASLQIPALGWSWHPFSISSDTDSEEIAFIIQVMKEQHSWTRQLVSHDIQQDLLSGAATVNLAGPYGYPVADLGGKYQSVIAIGTGTGIVPMFSLFWRRAKRLELLRKETLTKAALWSPRVDLKPEARKRMLTEKVPLLPKSPSLLKVASFVKSKTTLKAQHGPSVGMYVQLLQLRRRIAAVQKHGSRAQFCRQARTRNQIIERVQFIFQLLVLILCVLEVTSSAMLLSWTNLPVKASPTAGHGMVLRWMLVSNLAIYTLITLYRWCTPSRFPRSLGQCLDGLVLTGAILAVSLFWRRGDFDLEGGPAPLPERLGIDSRRVDLLVILSGFRVLRMIFTHTEGIPNGDANADLVGTGSLHLIWNCRSADLVASYLPMLAEMISSLRIKFGLSESGHDSVVTLSRNSTAESSISSKNARNKRATTLGSLEKNSEDASFGLAKFLSLRIFCTEPDPAKTEKLRALVQKLGLSQVVTFGRAELALEIVKQQTQILLKNMLVAFANSHHHTLVSFCGGPRLASVCRDGINLGNDLSASCLSPDVKMDFREESYGIVAGGTAKGPAPKPESLYSSSSMKYPPELPISSMG